MNCSDTVTYSQHENLIPMISHNSTPVQASSKMIDIEPLAQGAQELLNFKYATKEMNDLIQTDLERCNDETNEVSQDECALGHDMRECDPVYDGHHAMSYYNNLWEGLTCVRADCPNTGLSFGEMLKKKVKVHYYKLCENYKGN